MASASSNARRSTANILEDVVMTPPTPIVAPNVILEQPLKVQPPEQFDGTRGKVNVFIVQLQLYFGFQVAQFPTEISKTLYAASYLCGQAAEWFARYLEDYLDNMHTPSKMGNEAKIIFESFDNFRRAIVRIYGDPDQYKKAVINIQRLQQTESVQEYTSRFYAMSAKTEWDNDALSAIYYKGLKDPIKDELSRKDITKDMDEIVEKAIRIDNRLQERRAEKRSNNFTWAPNQWVQGQQT